MNKFFARVAVLCVCVSPVWADWSNPATGGPFSLTKDIFYASGSDTVNTIDNTEVMGFTIGDPLAGEAMTYGTLELTPGYYGGGRLGTGTSISVLGFQIAPASTPRYQDALQVGVPLSAPVNVTFSDQIDSSTANAGIEVDKIQDHLGTLTSVPVPIQTNTDALLQSVAITPATAWEGNTLYAVRVSSQIRSISGYILDPEARTIYLTLLDPRQNNLLLQAPHDAGSLSASAVVSAGGVTLSLSTDTLTDYAAILSSKDPINAPLRVDPKIVAEANQKAQSTSPYHIPVLLREMTAYDSQGRSVTRLAKPAVLTLGTRDDAATISASVRIRPNSIALWTLDEDHHLWIKVPGGQTSADGSGVSATITSLSVFALMGEAVESTTDVYAFPVPWRPHGPQAGEGPGQTGTIDGGITFANLPSECKIRIFTLNGELVREVNHSDVTGNIARETWDAKTTHGQAVASGVYFWRVESATDSKNGKLMVIR